MLWHYFALTIALERVAIREMAAQRELNEARPPAAVATPTSPEPEFAWG